MSKIIIKKETKHKDGIYILDIDKEAAMNIEGSSYADQINKAIDNFTNEMFLIERIERDTGESNKQTGKRARICR